ncbi:MAG: fimbrillin family protein [Rikenellaceae bacterium]
MKRLIIAALAVAAMVGCTKDLDGLNGSYDNAVSFSIGDIVDTRSVIKSEWSEDGTDLVGISSTDDEYSNVEYSVGTDGALSPAGTTTIYYPSQGSSMTFYAYYPYDSTTVDNKVSIDVSDQKKSIDLLVSDQASGTQGAADGVEFTFTHALSAVEITVRESDTVDIDMETLKLYTEEIVTDASYDLVAVSENLTLGETKNEVTFNLSANEDGSYLAQAILLPSDYTATKIYFSFDDPKGVSYLYQLELGKTYQSGYKYTYDAKIGVDYEVWFGEANELKWETSTPSGVATSQPDIAYDNDTYYIYSAKGLLAFSYLVSNTTTDSGATMWGESSNYDFSSTNNVNANAVLMADIDLGVLGNNVNWSPIGTSSKNYAGTFDGGGNTIEGLYINNDAAECQGLFGSTSGATLQNITLKDVSVSVSAYNIVGGLVGYIVGSTISNCHVVGGSVSANKGYVGGVAGCAETNACTIVNSSNSATVSISDTTGTPYAGGILGCNNADNTTITNCYNSGNISGSSTNGYIGGIVGYNLNCNIAITNCYSSGTLSYGQNRGGILGYHFFSDTTPYATLNYCYCSVDYSYVGGGSISGYITSNNCSHESLNDMKDETFAATLNNGAYTYNQGVADGGVLAYGWVAVESGTPDLDPDVTPTLSDDIDIAYAGGLYEINTAKGLLAFSCLVSYTSDTSGATTWGDSSAFNFSSGTNTGIEGKLMADINLGVLGNNVYWSPIGRKEENIDKPFSGTFDGDGYTISGLYINNTDDSSGYYQGLFGCTTSATLQNITLENVNVAGYNYVGGLVGQIEGSTISNCHVVGRGVSATADTASVGGLVGSTSNYTCTIINSSNGAPVSGSGSGSGTNTLYAGGIVGYNNAANTTIVNCYNNGSVFGSGDAGKIGGIVGSSNAALAINTCYSSGNISGGATGYMAGIVGYTSATLTLNSCFFQNGSILVGSGSTGTCTQDVYSGSVGGSIMTLQDPNATFLTWLNNGASTYNYGNSSSEIKAYKWTGVTGEYPKLDPESIPTFVADSDIVYNETDKIYEIKTHIGMLAFADLVNGTGNSQKIYGTLGYFDFTKKNLNINGKLVAEIDFNNLDGYTWTPIGKHIDSSNDGYSGTFDGNGYDIENLDIEVSNDKHQGLFGLTNGATLKNISLVGITVEGSIYVGGLAGEISGTTINNCSVSGSSSVEGDNNVGGLVGSSDSDVEITNCYVSGSVTGDVDGACVGGIVGCVGNQGTNITNCYNKSSVSGSNAYSQYQVSVGGIVGLDNASNNPSAITNCYNVGGISGGKEDCMGGIVGGASSKTTLKYCFANTDLVGSDSSNNPTIDETCKGEMTDDDMKLPEFVTKLNTGAYTYNSDKAATKDDAYGWKAGTDYPALDSSIVPTQE